MPSLLNRSVRFPSKRALVAVGGAAAVVAAGVAQTADTLAASTDAADASVTQIASENFFPTPLPASISCSESGSLGFHDANVSWPSAGPGMGYKLTLWDDAMNNVKRGPFFQTGTAWTFEVNYNLAWGNYVLTVQTVNLASGDSDAVRQVSSGHARITVGSNNQRNATCQGGAGRKANATWEDRSSWTPAAPARLGRSVTPGTTSAVTSPTTSATSTSTTPSGSASASAEPSTPQTSATETASPSAPAAPSTSVDPSPTSQTPTVDDAGVTTMGISLSGAGKELVVYRDGAEVCRTPLADGDQPSINGGTVSITNGGVVRSVDTSTCAIR